MSARQPKSGSKASRIRLRAPRRKLIDPEAGIDKRAENARVEAVLERLEPRVRELAAEALEKRDTHVLYVLDSHSTLMKALPGQRDLLARFREEMKHDTDVAVFPLEVLLRLVRMIVDVFPHFAPLLELLCEPPPPACVRMFIQIGASLGMRHVHMSIGPSEDTLESLRHRAGVKDSDRVAFEGADGPEEGITFEAFLKVLYAADTDRPGMDPHMRQVAQRIQRVVGAAMAVEAARTEPRPLDDVLREALDMPTLNAAIDREIKLGERGAFERTLDSILDARDVALA